MRAANSAFPEGMTGADRNPSHVVSWRVAVIRSPRTCRPAVDVGRHERFTTEIDDSADTEGDNGLRSAHLTANTLHVRSRPLEHQETFAVDIAHRLRSLPQATLLTEVREKRKESSALGLIV